jgi:hypothetical protein
MSEDLHQIDTEQVFEDFRAGELTRHEAAASLYRLGWRTDEIGAELNRIDEEAGRIQLEPAGEIPGETQ